MLSWLARCCGCGVRHHDQSQRAPAGAPRSVQMTDRGASYVRLQQALDQAAQQMAQATAAAAAQQQGPPPASTSALKRIPIVRVAADDLTKDNECCTICLEDHVPGGARGAPALRPPVPQGLRRGVAEPALCVSSVPLRAAHR